MSHPFSKAVPILKSIELSGYQAYFVGGSVRDHLLGRTIADIDIATSASPEELKKIFPKTTDVGIEHGTILIHYKGTPFEVTTFRTESGYTDFRRPDKVSFIRSLEEDLQRRDFTMNAIAMDKDGRIIDPFDGQGAINKKLIVTVGNPDERFGEDALRILRAVRFLSQLSFLIEKYTLNSIHKHGFLLKNIAVERKAAEFEKMLQGQNRSKAIELICSSGMYQFLPGLKQHKEGLINLSNRLSRELDSDEMWALLLYELNLESSEIESFLRGWKLPVQKIKKLKQLHSWLIYRISGGWNKDTVYKAGAETAIHAEKLFACIFPEKDSSLSYIDELYKNLPIKSKADLNATGNDLMEWSNKRPGPWIRVLLEEIEKSVIHGEVVNEREKIREWLSRCNPGLERN
ncbi:MAG TPA: CCA tRNA nucleotidyltransferase [Bacillus bacterium]|nr:CCA tRNA nucleotidyltransferase [Bacillus sp. (in: firmicutes)]